MSLEERLSPSSSVSYAGLVVPPSILKPVPQDDFDLDVDDGSETGRATIVPPFDVEAFARDSEMRQRAVLPPRQEDLTMDQARKLFESGDAEKALFLLSRLLEEVPLHSDARELSRACSDALEQACLAEIGSRAAVLVVAVSPDSLKAFGLDHVSGFLLSLMDGVSDVDTLLDLCALPRLLALRHLRNLVTRGIVAKKTRR
jgi:hypothetical protein